MKRWLQKKKRLMWGHRKKKNSVASETDLYLSKRKPKNDETTENETKEDTSQYDPIPVTSSYNLERKPKNDETTENETKEDTSQYDPIPVTSNENSKNDVFQKVIRKGKENRRSKIIVGTATSSTIKASAQYGYLHVFNLSPKTSSEDIIKHLTAHNLSKVQCDAMTSKYPEKYSSFKLTFPIELLDVVRNPTVWPRGTKINRFFMNVGKKIINT
ncbi:hypothetical protein QE152_g9542 [Popillia japonica]|uniref:Uncharacterized protein n=1 Tax=Popillia japonica TaxID=7064 RepID=A0AAW1LUB5_POPJA